MIEQLENIMTSEEPAVVKAQIVIVKGGNFADNQSEEDDPFSSMMAGIDIDNEVMSQFNELTSALGIDDESFTGYKDGEVIKVQLNPNSYSIKSITNFRGGMMGGMKGKDNTANIFGPSKPRELSVELFYDTNLQADYLEKIKNTTSDIVKSLNSATSLMTAVTSSLSVYKKYNTKEDLNKLYLNKLMGLTRVLKGINTPPIISFKYGSTEFEGYAKEVSVKYERFNKEGEVTRATVFLSIKESNAFDKLNNSSSSQETGLPDISSISNVLSTDELI